MNKIKKEKFQLFALKGLCILALVTLLSCKKNSDSQQAVVTDTTRNQANEFDEVLANSNKLLYTGRVNLSTPTAPIFINASSGVEMNFTGSAVYATLKSYNTDSCFLAIIDNNMATAKKIKTTPTQTKYLLANNLNLNVHNVKLVKIMPNWVTGFFYKFNIDSGKAQAAPAPLERKMEFYGDSQTEGASSEAPIGNDPTGTGNTYYNSHITYAGITARAFNAQYSNISYSGIGLTGGYTNRNMPEVFDGYSLNDTTLKWNFSSYVPDVVVINLFQNDQAISNPSSAQYQKWYTDRGIVPNTAFYVAQYKAFITTLRGKYPNAHIICVLGSMGVTNSTQWKGYITSAVSDLKASGYTRLYTNFFPFKNTPGHPKVSEHQAMANNLIAFIKANGIWQ